MSVCPLVRCDAFPRHHQKRRVTNQVEQIIKPATRISGRPAVQLGLHPSYRQKGPSLAGPFRGAGIHRRVFDHGSPLLVKHAAVLPHVASSPGLGVLRRLRPVRDIQQATHLSPEGAAHRRFPCSLSFGRRVRHPALPLRHRRGYAVDLHHDLPGPAHLTDPTVPHQPRRHGLQPRPAGTHRSPAPIRRVRAG